MSQTATLLSHAQPDRPSSPQHCDEPSAFPEPMQSILPPSCSSRTCSLIEVSPIGSVYSAVFASLHVTLEEYPGFAVESHLFSLHTFDPPFELRQQNHEIELYQPLFPLHDDKSTVSV